MSIIMWHQDDTRSMDITPGSVGDVSSERKFEYHEAATTDDIIREEVSSNWRGNDKHLLQVIQPDQFTLEDIGAGAEGCIDIHIRVHPNHTLDAVRSPTGYQFNSRQSLELQKQADIILWSAVNKELTLPTNECTEMPDFSVTQCLKIGNTIIAFCTLLGHDKITCAVRDHEESEWREFERQQRVLDIAEITESME